MAGRRIWVVCVMLCCAPGLSGLAETPSEPVPAPADQMRELWEPAQAGFIREWLVLGEFPSPPSGEQTAAGYEYGQGYVTDFLAGAGGEAEARPEAGDEVARSDGSMATWAEYESPGDTLNFVGRFGEGRDTTHVAAYAYATVTRAEAGPALLALGSDDGVKVWVNGELVHANAVPRGVQPDQDLVDIDLKAGPNALLFKVEQGKGGWGLVARVVEPSMRTALGVDTARIELLASDDLRLRIRAGTTGGRTTPAVVTLRGASGTVYAEQACRLGDVVTFDVGKMHGPFAIHLATRDRQGRPQTDRRLWYAGNLRAALREYLEVKRKIEPGSEEALVRGMLLELIEERAGGDLDNTPEARLAPLALALWEDGQFRHDNRAGKGGGLFRMAWRDPLDDSPQFCRAYTPTDYNPAHAYPLVVNLHGYNPRNPRYIDWWGSTRPYHPTPDRFGVVWIEPHGRGNTGYHGIGHADVLRCIAEAKSRFNIDPDRVYLMGYSMGGGGTWALGTRSPQTFAAIAPIYGGWDYRVGIDPEDFARHTPYQHHQHERWSSFQHAEALRSTPVFINHGDEDGLVEVDHSRYAARLLQRWGYHVRYWEHPGKGHGNLGCEDEIMRFFLSHQRDTAPGEVRVRTADLRDARAHWLRLSQLDDPFAFAQARAQIIDDQTVALETRNVIEARIGPIGSGVDAVKPKVVLWNGKAHEVVPDADGAVVLRAEGYEPGGLVKTPERAGPFDDVQRKPFAIVIGTTAKDPALRALVRRQAEKAVAEWEEWQKTTPRVFEDTQITPEQIDRYTLRLFGGPEANAVTAQLIADLPLAIESGAITIDGQRFAGNDLGVQVVYPHPRNDTQYVAIHAGTSLAGQYFGDRLPWDMDFAVTDGAISDDEAGRPEEKVMVAMGRFDQAWRFKEAYTFRGDPASRAKAVRRVAPKYVTTDVPDDTLSLSEVLEASATGSFAHMSRDTNSRGQPITLDDKTYDQGIATWVWHEPNVAAWALGGKWKRLRATLGIEVEIDDDPEQAEKQRANTMVVFIVRGDGEVLFESEPFAWDDGPRPLDIDVTGVETLELEVLNRSRWHNAAYSVDWAELRLER